MIDPWPAAGCGQTPVRHRRTRLATRLGIRKLDLGDKGGRIQFVEKPNVDPMAVIRLIQASLKHYRMDGPDKLRISLDLADAATRFNAARGLLAAL